MRINLLKFSSILVDEISKRFVLTASCFASNERVGDVSADKSVEIPSRRGGMRSIIFTGLSESRQIRPDLDSAPDVGIWPNSTLTKWWSSVIEWLRARKSREASCICQETIRRSWRTFSSVNCAKWNCANLSTFFAPSRVRKRRRSTRRGWK